jgi:hypothetical protein
MEEGKNEGRTRRGGEKYSRRTKGREQGGGTLLPLLASFLGSSFFAERALKVEGVCEEQRKRKGQI